MTLSSPCSTGLLAGLLLDEKSLSPLFPVGVWGGGGSEGAVVTNDWCISPVVKFRTCDREFPGSNPGRCICFILVL